MPKSNTEHTFVFALNIARLSLQCWTTEDAWMVVATLRIGGEVAARSSCDSELVECFRIEPTSCVKCSSEHARFDVRVGTMVVPVPDQVADEIAQSLRRCGVPVEDFRSGDRGSRRRPV